MKKLFICLGIIVCILVVTQNYSLAGSAKKKSTKAGYTSSKTGELPTINEKIEYDPAMKPTMQEIYNRVAFICYGAAVIVILIQGVKFMIAAPSAQAEIKKQSIAIVTGAVIVTSIIAIVQILMDFVNSIF